MKPKKNRTVHNAPESIVSDGKSMQAIDRREVTVMAVSGRYAMVRRPGCMPYVALVKELGEFSL